MCLQVTSRRGQRPLLVAGRFWNGVCLRSGGYRAGRLWREAHKRAAKAAVDGRDRERGAEREPVSGCR